MSLKTALVTGSSRGIGKAIVLELAQKGWDVVVNYRGDRQAAQETTQLAQENGANALTIQADISSRDDRERMLSEVRNKYGKIDLLVNNAGMAPRKRVNLLEVSEESYDEVMSANLKGPFFLSQAVAGWMVELITDGKVKNPAIINIGSISAYTASPERSEYCLSKAGMAMMTALFATTLADAGINVYEIRPGIIQTDMTSVAKEKYDRLIEQGLTPIRRWGQPEDVARVVSAIADGDLAFSTGEIINVDGGFHLRRL